MTVAVGVHLQRQQRQKAAAGLCAPRLLPRHRQPAACVGTSSARSAVLAPTPKAGFSAAGHVPKIASISRFLVCGGDVAMLRQRRRVRDSYTYTHADTPRLSHYRNMG